MDYTRDENNYTFTATLNVKGEECEPPGCEQQHRDLSACEIKVINISHPSCEPPLEYLLEVPPGKCQLLAICVFTTTVRFCVWIVGRRGEGTLAAVGAGGRAALLTQWKWCPGRSLLSSSLTRLPAPLFLRGLCRQI